jgi:hypothetical protein
MASVCNAGGDSTLPYWARSLPGGHVLQNTMNRRKSMRISDSRQNPTLGEPQFPWPSLGLVDVIESENSDKNHL